MYDLSKIFGQNLKRLRKDSNLSQRNFSEKADLNEQVIIDLEKGQKGIHFLTIEKYAMLLIYRPRNYLKQIL